MNHSILNQPYESPESIKERFAKMSLESLCVEIVQHRELDSLSFAEKEIVSRLEKSNRLTLPSDGWVGERVAN